MPSVEKKEKKTCTRTDHYHNTQPGIHTTLRVQLQPAANWRGDCRADHVGGRAWESSTRRRRRLVCFQSVRGNYR